MSELTYDRRTARVVVAATDESVIDVRFGRKRLQIPRTSSPLEMGARLRAGGLQRWWHGLQRSAGRAPYIPNHETLSVIELETSSELARLPWEEIFESAVGKLDPYPACSILRSCPAPSRATPWAMVLPLRMLQAGTSLSPIQGRVDNLFNWQVTSRQLVLDSASCARDVVLDWWRASGSTSVDVLEVDVDAELDDAELTSAADPERPGTVAWLERVCHQLQVRLLVLVANDDTAASSANAMAKRVVDRGGPAVMVLMSSAELNLQVVYQEIVHDRPLDWIVSSASRLTWGGLPPVTLFADRARADALRVSAAFRPTVDATELFVLGQEPVTLTQEVSNLLTFLVAQSPAPSADWVESAWERQGQEFLKEWSDASFSLHESDGILPMQRALRRLRSSLRLPEYVDVRAFDSDTTEAKDQPLVVTPRVSQEEAGQVRDIEQVGDEIARYLPLLLGLGIGPYDNLVAVAHAAALLQSAVFPDPDALGSWLDVVVVGLDTTVVGEATQRLWVPRKDASERATFRINPGSRKSWRARLCLYHDNLLLQAILVAGVSGPVPDEHRRRLLARKLGLGLDELPAGATWYARNEYTMTAGEIGELPGRERRVLNITANSLDDTRNVTFKDHDLMTTVRLDDTVDQKVSSARAALALVSTPPDDEILDPDNFPYGFEDDNSAAPGDYEAALTSLARQGWLLYESLVPLSSREQVTAVLNADDETPMNGSIVSVSHLLVEKVLPWAMVYDREFDPDGQQGVACPAQLPDHELPARCGELDTCPLSAVGQRQRTDAGQPELVESEVACPRHFWGFRHILELPVSRNGTAPSMTTNGSGPILAGFGQHHDLKLVDPHLAELTSLINSGASPIPWQHGNRGQFKRALRTELDVDLLYLYCHAGYDGSDPVIRVKDATDAVEGLLRSADVSGDRFRTQPLVFINGCRTAGFSPKALSPFITTLVTDRNASGLVGTEIDVWEQLASEVGREFIGKLCNEPGMTVGRALRETRLALLAKGNPLGLAYTLYALADLRLR